MVCVVIHRGVGKRASLAATAIQPSALGWASALARLRYAGRLTLPLPLALAPREIDKLAHLDRRVPILALRLGGRVGVL